MAYSGSSVSSSKPQDPQTSILKERANLDFDLDTMYAFLEGNQERAEKSRELMQQMERDPILASKADYFDLTKEQQRALTMEKIGRIGRYIEIDDIDSVNQRLSLIGVFDPQVATRIAVNLGLFLSCIRGNGTAEQLQYWALAKEDIYIRNIYGCFGMTELAHGSNVAGLETTATFDIENDQFIIHTPHIGATKWWIGGAAHSATHCTVYARLIVKGQDYGVKTFVVPLRDSQHNLNPGVTVGDIGSKMGRDGIDNGWIQFSHVRIPREFMLQKFCKVSREGDVVLPPLEQLAYSALLSGRVMMVCDSFRVISRFATIALRYAVGRRQFKGPSSKDGGETQLLDYPLHQRRLIPYLALAYVISASAYRIELTIKDTLDTLDEAVANDDLPAIMTSIDALKSLFIDSGALKSTCTWLGAEVIDETRQSCGGHGYSAYNGFGKAYNDWVVQCTWEGDNNVLAMSIGKPLVKNIVAILENDKVVKGSSAFLNDIKTFGNKTPFLTKKEDLNDPAKLLRAIEVAIIRTGAAAAKVYKENNDSSDSISAYAVALSKLKAHHYMFQEFLRRISETKDDKIVHYLNKLGLVYVNTIVLENFASQFLTYSVIDQDLFAYLTSHHIPESLLEIRPHVIPLSDAFQQSDLMINSQIGLYNGNIYENYFTTVKQLNPPINTQAPYSSELVAMLNRGDLNTRDRGEKSKETLAKLGK